MRLLRYLDIIDLGVAVVVLGYLLLPPREIFASSAHQGSETEQFALALAEARTMAHPEDGAAIEIAVRGSERAGQSPTRWRALLAASIAYVDRLDVKPGLDYANRAMAACDEQRAVCPSWEQIRMKLYQQHLDAGVKSGIDPHRGPEAARAFRQAGESALRTIHVGGGHDVERGATPARTEGSNAAPRSPAP